MRAFPAGRPALLYTLASLAILGSRTLIPDDLRDLFATRLQPVYASRAATVRPVLRRTTVDAAGTVAISVDFVGNGASFVLIKVTSKGE